MTIVSDEDHLPYDRPPLSKEVLRAEADDVTLKPAEFYEENDITVRLGNGVRSVDPTAQTVTLADGSELGYDELIIATGLVPRTIPSFPDLEGIRVLRSLDESIALREHAGSARNAVVVGAGFIGCEVAASLRGMGVNVVLVEPQPTPLASVLGEQIGALVTRLHEAEGVDVRCDVGVDEVRGTDHVEKVVLSDGTELDADLVVVGIGSKPAIEWLDGSGIELDNGVVCDDVGRTQPPMSGRSATSRHGFIRWDIKSALSIGATLPTRRGSWCPRCSARRSRRRSRCPTSGATSTTSRSSAWANRRPTTSCTWSRTTAASSWRSTNVTAWSQASSAAGCPAR